MPLAFDLNEAARHLSTHDPTLGRLIRRIGPCTYRPRATGSVFAALAESIVYQQLSGKAAATIFARTRALYAPKRFPTPAELLATPVDRLRSAGLSAAKAAALLDLARLTLDGTVPPLARVRRLDDEALVGRLTQVRGIGRWTVEMLLIFRLGRPDVLPVGDLGVRKGFATLYRRPELPTAEELTAHAERWRPYRTLGSWYMWRALDPGTVPVRRLTSTRRAGATARGRS
jgi:3-methyladenine DNA glycosylase/8-oxoguanine DNA glycosylase